MTVTHASCRIMLILKLKLVCVAVTIHFLKVLIVRVFDDRVGNFSIRLLANMNITERIF